MSKKIEKADQHVWEIFQDNLFNDLVPLCNYGSKSLKLKKCTAFKKADALFKKGQCLTFNEKSLTPKLGKSRGLNFLANYAYPGTSLELKEPIILTLHEAGKMPDIMNMKGKNFEILPGRIVDLKISTTVIDTTDDFNAIDFESRLCNNDMISPGSSRLISGEVNCLTKHILEKAKLDCDCHPFYLNSSANMKCNTFSQAYCFEEALKNGSENLDLHQNCYKDCKRVQYGLELSGDQPISDILSNFDIYGDDFADYFFNISDLHSFLGDHSTQNQFLEPKLKRMSLISINFEGPEVLTVTKDAKITVPDMIGNIGGTLGVFIGFSFIGLLDSLIEFVQYLKRRLRRK